ncbi:MAG TPA: bifunctional UDP-sugar hydrolase/5'-nucleotidase, partial [Phenylobacterium sp.]|nr:bifunctional UDP-sugar hydrolase/5'-nucleotidase [Phenylobacterium sp.]
MSPRILGLVFTAVIALASGAVSAVAGPAGPGKVSLTFLSTTDLHGRLEAWDYAADRPANSGLVKIATLVKRARAEVPDAVLVDIGDMVQDPNSTLTNYFLSHRAKTLNPNIAAMNQLRYDAMAVGNHEFNFAPEPLWTLKSAAKFPWLCANLKQPYTSGAAYFPPYIIKTIQGVRVGIVAFVAPVAAPKAGYDFEPILPAAKRVIPELRSKVDLVVVLLHSGFVRDPVTGEAAGRIQVPGENVAPELAEQVPGIDVIIFGHTHTELPEKFVNGVLMTEAKFWAQSLARVDVTMAKGPDGRWGVADKHARTIPVTAETPSEPGMEAVLRPYRRTLERHLNTTIATAAADLSGRHARYEETPLLDVIQQAQLQAGHADVSMASVLDERVTIPRGPVTVRQAGAIYPASNNVGVVEMTGAGLKAVLEHSAGFYPQWPPTGGAALALPAVNPDQAAGVSYVIDLTRPVGSRILDLTFRGKPLDPDRKLRVAVPPNRRIGEDGYVMYKGLPVVAQTGDMRDVLADHLTRTRTLPTQAEGTWRIVPPEAVQAMEKLADAGAGGK